MSEEKIDEGGSLEMVWLWSESGYQGMGRTGRRGQRLLRHPVRAVGLQHALLNISRFGVEGDCASEMRAAGARPIPTTNVRPLETVAGSTLGGRLPTGLLASGRMRRDDDAANRV